MPDREKVMAGLVTCIAACNGKTVCLDCRYMHDYSGGCETQLLSDALAMLKAQEPRVMTLSEALAADYVYLEIKLHASLPCECCILAVDPDGGILPLHKGFCAYLDGEEYGETWRCWTSRPTEEQRRAEPWER